MAKSDPLANVKIGPPKTAADAQASAAEALADAVTTAAEKEADVPSASNGVDKVALKNEKRKVRPPSTAKPAKLLARYTVLADQNVSWRGQQMRLKAQRSVISDAKQGPGAVQAFQAMGVKMEEIK